MSPRFTKAPPQTGLPETESSVLKGQLTKLGVHSIAATFEAEADRATKSETSFTAYLGRLVDLRRLDLLVVDELGTYLWMAGAPTCSFNWSRPATPAAHC